MQFLVKGTFYRLLYMGCTFCIGLLFASLSGKYIFGTISIMTANMAIVVILTGMGHDASLVWHRSANQLSTAQAFSYALGIGLQQLLLYGLITVVYYHFTGRLLISQQSASFLTFEILYFLGIIFLDKYVALFYASGRAIQCNGVLFITSLLLLLLLWVGTRRGVIQVNHALPVYCIYHFLMTGILALFFHAQGGLGRLHLGTSATLRSFFFFSLTVFLTNLLQFLAYRADYWFLEYYYSLAEVGVYAQANRFSQLLWVVPNIVAAIIASSMSQQASSLQVTDLQFTVRVMNLLNLLLIPVLLLVTWSGYRWVLPDFMSGWEIIPYMLIGFFFFCNTILLAAYFSAQKKLGINLMVSGICLLLIGSLDALLIPRWGIQGAGWANAVAYSISGLLTIWFYARQASVPLTQLLWVQRGDLKRALQLIRFT